MERPLVIAFGISLGCHVLLLGSQLIQFRVSMLSKSRQALEVIYEYQLAEEELRQLQHKLEERSRHPSAPTGVSAPVPQIRVPDRPIAAVSPSLSGLSASRTAIVDLTNLTAAARGDPVLLSYFSAIREQIQHTANQRTWLAGEAAQGIVYVSFVLDSSGRVHSVAIVSERSAPSRLLQEIALRIIKAAGLFPPFPPSLAEPSKTVVVPLEFLLSS